MEGFGQHLSFRFMAMVRGGLIGMIYNKLAASPTATKDAGDSKVMTLIGTDIERICLTWFLAISSLIPSVVQLGLAVWLLERQLGVVCVAPVILVLRMTLELLMKTSMEYTNLLKYPLRPHFELLHSSAADRKYGYRQYRRE